MSQTSISASGQQAGVAGQIFDNAEVVDVVSAFNEGPGSVPFGCAVKQGVADQGCAPLSTSGDTIIGINVWGMNHMVAGPTDPSGNPSGDLDSVGVMINGGIQLGRRGRFWLPIDVGITINVNDRGWARFRTDGANNTQVGTWSNAQDGGSNLIDCTRLVVFRSKVFTAPTPTPGTNGLGTNIAVAEIDFQNRNS